MVERVAGRLKHPRQQTSDLQDVALAGSKVDMGDLGGLVVGRDHAAVVLLLQFGDAADMIVMVVGDENIAQRPALALERVDDGGGFRGIDRGGCLGRGIVNQIAEIIGQAGEQAYFGSHDISVASGGSLWASSGHEIGR